MGIGYIARAQGMKQNSSIAIIGLGVVGKAQALLFRNHPLTFYDPDPGVASFLDANRLKGVLPGEIGECRFCDVVFICVPTPMKPDGSCNIHYVEESVSLGTQDGQLIIICSTIVPGTLENLQKKFPKRFFVFQPEYLGETVAHPLTVLKDRTFLILGGEKSACGLAVRLYQTVHNATIRIFITTGAEAEIIKYMENSAIAAKVTLANEFYNICKLFGADYNMVREGFLLDPRMSRYFTFVYPDQRGFGGKCLPKDLRAIYQACLAKGYRAEFLQAILENNDRIKRPDEDS